MREDRRWLGDISAGWVEASPYNLPADEMGGEILLSVPVLVWAPKHMRYATVGWYNYLYDRWDSPHGWLDDVTHWCAFPYTPEG